MGKIKIISVVVSNKGDFRKINQDNFLLNAEGGNINVQNDIVKRSESRDILQIYGLFDGMGGESYGEKAALISAQIAAHYRECLQAKTVDELRKYLQMYFRDANKKICEMTKAMRVQTSGSTAAVAWLYKDIFYCANIGDTRIYLFRDNKLQQLSLDHTEENLFLKINLPAENQRVNCSRQRLTQHLGIEEEEMIIEPYYFNVKPNDNDILLLCSDGLKEKMSDEMIKTILLQNPDRERAVQLLIKQALALGSKDNITVMLLQVCKSFWSL